METRARIMDILKKAYQVEVDGYTFYAMTAAQATNQAVKELFQKLADDEVLHQKYLKTVGTKFAKHGVAAFATVGRKTAAMGKFSTELFTERFREQAKGAAFEMGVLSVGLTLETNAMACFTKAAKAADSAEVKEFYGALAAWERQHYEALNKLYNSLRADFWGEANFWPF